MSRQRVAESMGHQAADLEYQDDLGEGKGLHDTPAELSQAPLVPQRTALAVLVRVWAAPHGRSPSRDCIQPHPCQALD